MSEVPRILGSIQTGDPQPAEPLLPLVYSELRKLTPHPMASQAAGHTLRTTALVHEAWMRRAGNEPGHWKFP